MEVVVLMATWSNFPNPLGEVFEKVLNTDDLIPQKGWIVFGNLGVLINTVI